MRKLKKGTANSATPSRGQSESKLKLSSEDSVSLGGDQVTQGLSLHGKGHGGGKHK